MNWYTAERVTVSSGSSIVRVVSGESVSAIRAHDGLEINSFNAVDIELTYTEEGTGDQIIQLVRPWPHASQTEQAAQVVPTAAHFNDSVQVLTNTYEHVFAHLGSYFSFGTQASGTVTFKAVRVDESDVTVRCINQWNADLSALELSASSSVADLNAIDTAINGSGGLMEVAAQVSDDLEAVDTVLSGYVATAKTYRDNALTYRNTAENYRDEAEGLRDTTYSYRNEVSGWHTSISGWKTAAESARDLAEQYRDEAEAFKNQAGQIVGGNYVDQSTKVNGKALSGDIELDHEDVGALASTSLAVGIIAENDRDLDLQPDNDYFDASLRFDFKGRSSVGNCPVFATSAYSHIISVSGWRDSSGGFPSQMSIGQGRLAIRSGTSNTEWGTWFEAFTANHLPELSEVNGLVTALNAKASNSDMNTALALKTDKTTTNNMQTQLDEIELFALAGL
jgi:hypothetical protein